MIVYNRHIRAADLCSRGARKWFDSHGLDWSDFLTNGIDEEILLGLNDGLANRVIDVARRESADGRK